jgi:hypothetical protein
MNVGIGTETVKFRFWGIFVSNIRYTVFAEYLLCTFFTVDIIWVNCSLFWYGLIILRFEYDVS